MASEVKQTISLSALKDGASILMSSTVSFDMAGSAMFKNVQSVGTSAELIGMGDVTTAKWLVLRNMSAADDVAVYIDSGGTQQCGTLEPGQSTILCGVSGIYAKSLGAGAINVEVAAIIA